MSNRKMKNPFAALHDLDVNEPDFVFAPSRLNHISEQLATIPPNNHSTSSSSSSSSVNQLVSLSSSSDINDSLPNSSDTTSNNGNTSNIPSKVDLLGITNELEKALDSSDDDDDEEYDSDNRNTLDEPNELDGKTHGTPWNRVSSEKKSSSSNKKVKQRHAFDFSSFSKIATETEEEIKEREEKEKQRQLEMEQTLMNRLESIYALERDDFKEKVSKMDLSSKHRHRRLIMGEQGKQYNERQGAKAMKRNEARKRLNKAKHSY